MKKLCIIAVIAIFSFASINAQNIRFGAKAGVNLASINGDETDDFDMRTSFHVGAVVEIPLSDKFSVQPELLYSSQGAKSEFSELDVTGDYKFKLDYLNVPIMMKYYVTEGLSLEAGPQIGILLAANTELEVGDVSEEEDVKEFMKDIDFGLNFGAGYQLENGLNFSARYNLGLSNIIDVEESDDSKIHNGVIQVSVGFFF